MYYRRRHPTFRSFHLNHIIVSRKQKNGTSSDTMRVFPRLKERLSISQRSIIWGSMRVDTTGLAISIFDISTFNQKTALFRGHLYLFRDSAEESIKKVNDKVITIEHPLLEDAVSLPRSNFISYSFPVLSRTPTFRFHIHSQWGRTHSSHSRHWKSSVGQISVWVSDLLIWMEERWWSSEVQRIAMLIRSWEFAMGWLLSNSKALSEDILRAAESPMSDYP